MPCWLPVMLPLLVIENAAAEDKALIAADAFALMLPLLAIVTGAAE